MAKTASWVFGVILVVAGVWGFFGEVAVGFIAASKVSSVIHVIAGLALLAMAGKPSAGMMLKVVGVVYVLWGVLGMLGWATAWSPESNVTNWFYLVVGIVLAVIGFMNKGGSAATVPPAAPQM